MQANPSREQYGEKPWRSRKPSHIAKGSVLGEQLRINCLFDPETFAALRARAVAEQTSLAEQVRLLVEWGLETEKDT